MGEKNNNSTYKTEEGSDRVYQNVYKYEGYTIKSALSDALNGACLAPLCLLHLFFFSSEVCSLTLLSSLLPPPSHLRAVSILGTIPALGHSAVERF